jgi:hypothetical protein
MPAFETNTIPIIIVTQNKDDSDPANVPNREDVECLKVPALANIAIAAHPCDRDTRTILIKVILDLVRIPTNINVICVTLLYATNFFKSLCKKVTIPDKRARKIQITENQEILILMLNIPTIRPAP